MNKKIRQITIIIIFAILILFNNTVMPVKNELSDLDLIKVVGLDVINEGIYKVQHTNVKVNDTDQSSSGGGGGSSGGGSSGGQSSQGQGQGQGQSGNKIEENEENDKIFSVKAATFSDAVRAFQTYTNKNMSGSHVKFFLFGENLAKNDISESIDFNVRDYEVRKNALVFITKGTSARDFLDEATRGSYPVDEKLQSMTKNNEAKGVSYKTTLTDALRIISSCSGAGLIPTIKIIDNEEIKNSQKEDPRQDTSNSIIDKQTAIPITDDIFFDYDGFGVIKDGKLIGYLDREQSFTANLLTNKLQGSNINIYLGENQTVSCGITLSLTKYKFKFDENDNISEISINTMFRDNIEDIYAKDYKIDDKFIKDLEKKQSQQIKARIEDLITKIREFNADFLNIKDVFKQSHPYKYRKIEDKWNEQLMNAKITVEVESNIQRTYDITGLYTEEK